MPLVLLLAASSLLAASGPAGAKADAKPPNAAPTASSTSDPSAPGAPGASSTESLIITGEKPIIERGDKSRFTALPPREVLERPLTESPGLETATTVIGEQEIEWLNAFTVLDAMKYAPGAWTESRGRKEKQLFSVRGQRYPYPEYLVDGAWFREFTETTFFLNAAHVERLEITRSSSDLLLTPGGMVGNINLVPKTYLVPETHVKAEYGSFHTARGQLSHGGPLGKGSYGLGLGHQHTDGPEDKHAAENVSDLYGRVLYPVTPRLQLSLMGFAMYGDRELKLAEPPAQAALRTRRDSFDPMRYYFLVAQARYEVPDTAVTELTFNYGRRRFDGYQDGRPTGLEKDHEYGFRLVQGLRLSEANRLRVAGMYNHWESPTGKRFYLGKPGDLHTYALALTDEHQVDRLTVNAGYRLSRTYVKEFGGFNVEGAQGRLSTVKVDDQWEDPLHTVNVGGKYQLTDIFSLHANVAWGQIAARPGMLNAARERPGTETRLKYDLGVKAAWDQFGEATLTGFYVDQHDAPLALNQTVTVDGIPFVLYENADAQNVGIELDLRSRRFASGFQLFFNTVGMWTRREQAGDWVDDREVPNVILGGGLSYLYQRFEAALLTKHVGPYENDRFLPAGSRPAPLGDFTELNALLNFYLGKHRQHRVYFGVDNLTDERYSTVAGYPDEGRFYKGGVSLYF